MTDTPVTRWAVIDADGHLRTSHGRLASAWLNADGLDVVPVSGGIDRDPLNWRFDRASAEWVRLAEPRVLADPSAPQTYADHRRVAYGRELEGDRQLEAIVEALTGLATPAARAAAPGAFDRLDALREQIAAIKARHPKT